jgi:magnesium chelatase subunit I
MSENYENIVERSYSSVPKYTEVQAGVPEDYNDVKTLGDLLEINFKLIHVKEQLRKNLISKIERDESKYPEIIGYEDDVIPSLDRAILSRHDIFLIGQIGQGKTKLIQTIAENLLSPIPIIQHSITNDCPMDLPKKELVSLLEGKTVHAKNPKFYVDPESAEKIRENKLETPIEWIDGKDRYKYVLATPDISVKDLVGYIDAVKVAKMGIEMYKIESYSPGQLMQAKHGIFCIDELPVLDPRKQVALLSVLQEGYFTTGSYPVIFEPKTVFFATANPIDYTHSGKVIEPLYDRLKSHIYTHYPNTIEDEMMIIIQEANISKSLILSPLLKTLAKVVQKTRNSTQINQETGVSVRLGIHGLELLVGESERTRALPNKILSVPRISDMHCLNQVVKFQLSELDDTVKNREKVFDEFLKESIKETCLEYLEDIDNTTLESIKQEFGENTFQVSQNLIWKNGETSYSRQLGNFSKLKKIVESKLNIIQSSQNALKQQLELFKIDPKYVELTKQHENELLSALIEIILEGLCWTNPKILDKNEAGYGPA